MIEQLEQMMEISKALESAADEGDVDRVIELLKRHKELAERMGKLDPDDPDVKSGKAAEMYKEIVAMNIELERKFVGLMGNIQNAIQAVQGEKKMVEGYLNQADASEPKYIDREG